MNTGLRGIKFWLRSWLQGVGMCLGGALLFTLLYSTGKVNTGGESLTETLLGLTSLYAYYLFFIGSIILFMFSVSWFQTYFSVLVSMNATRRSVVLGILATLLLVILGLLAVASVLWLITGNEMAAAGLKQLPLIGGLLFAVAAVSLALSVVIVRWGKIGIIIFSGLGMAMGLSLGIWFAASDGELLLRGLPGSARILSPIILLVGILLYLLSGLFVFLSMRKMEVRA